MKPVTSPEKETAPYFNFEIIYPQPVVNGFPCPSLPSLSVLTAGVAGLNPAIWELNEIIVLLLFF